MSCSAYKWAEAFESHTIFNTYFYFDFSNIQCCLKLIFSSQLWVIFDLHGVLADF